MLTAKDAVQREKDALLSDIRHFASLCTCPNYITVGDLQNIIFVLQGGATTHKKFTICFPRKELIVIKDMFGKQICVGDVVLKPIKLGNSPFIEKRFVSSISGDRLYLDDSKVPINYPNRLVVFSKATTQ